MKRNMEISKKTLILRHRKENLKKCSLTGLESREDMEFFTYPKSGPSSLENYFILTLDAPALTYEDRNLGVFLIDGTWKLAEKMFNNLPCSNKLELRSLPSDWKTAYPRVQTGCIDPLRGLASIEALYATYLILGKKTEGLLDNYYFKDEFIQLNQEAIKKALPLTQIR